MLTELGLTFEPIYLDFQKGEQKAPDYVTKYNPNGRIPAIVDHKNNDFILWESDAVIMYLIARYDTTHRISFTPAAGGAYFQQLQWLFFQSSGQGPYFGQAAWFWRWHPEKVPSAVERYVKEIRRVLGVLDSVLKKQDWLVGNKLSVADMAFIT